VHARRAACAQGRQLVYNRQRLLALVCGLVKRRLVLPRSSKGDVFSDGRGRNGPSPSRYRVISTADSSACFNTCRAAVPLRWDGWPHFRSSHVTYTSMVARVSSFFHQSKRAFALGERLLPDLAGAVATTERASRQASR